MHIYMYIYTVSLPLNSAHVIISFIFPSSYFPPSPSLSQRYGYSLDRKKAAYTQRLLQSYSSGLDTPNLIRDSGDDTCNNSLTDGREETLTKVHINLSQYKLGLPHVPCSLEALGIIPTR